MKINRDNYEAFFLDYHEGALTDSGKEELLLFVEANPDLKDEFYGFEKTLVPPSNARFPGKHTLKHDVTDEEMAAVELLKHTYLKPDYSIVFKNKSALKKSTIVIPMWARVSAAATVMIGLLFYVLIDKENGRQVAVHQMTPATNSAVSKPDSNPATSVEKRTPVGELQTPKLSNKKIQIKSNPVSGKALQAEPLAVVPDNTQQPEQKNHPENPIPEPAADQTPVYASKEEPTEQPFKVFSEEELKELREQAVAKNATATPQPLLGTILTGMNNFLGIDAGYSRKSTTSAVKETYALGPFAITKTVVR